MASAGRFVLLKASTIGLDVAKNVFQLHGVDEKGRIVSRKGLRRAYVAAFFADPPRCLVGIEVCGSAPYWARRL